MTIFAILAISYGRTAQTAAARELQRGDGYQVIALVNQVRSGYGLSPLQAKSELMVAAQGHSDYQASVGSVTHTGSGGSSPLSRALAAGYGGGAKVYVTENIYGGNDASPSQAVSWWKGDSVHLQAMINPNAIDAGAGIASSGSMVYYTLDIGYIAGQEGSAATNVPGVGGTRPPTAIPIIMIQTATPNADGSIIHIVQSGQALWNIAAAYKISLTDLMNMNGLTEDSLIYPGQKILVHQAAQFTPTLGASSTLLPNLTATLQNPPKTKLPETALVSGTPIWTATLPLSATPNVNIHKTKPAPVDPIRWLIIGLFIIGGGLILIGSLARPRA